MKFAQRKCYCNKSLVKLIEPYTYDEKGYPLLLHSVKEGKMETSFQSLVSGGGCWKKSEKASAIWYYTGWSLGDCWKNGIMHLNIKVWNKYICLVPSTFFTILLHYTIFLPFYCFLKWNKNFGTNFVKCRPARTKCS